MKTSTGGGTIVRTVRWFHDKTINVRIGNTVERIKASTAGTAGVRSRPSPTRVLHKALNPTVATMLESVDRSQNQYWCFQWWNHSEAVDRLRALYEQLLEAQVNGGMSSWWIDHFDRHTTVLSAKRGLFGECGTTHMDKTSRRILVLEQPPFGWGRWIPVLQAGSEVR